MDINPCPCAREACKFWLGRRWVGSGADPKRGGCRPRREAEAPGKPEGARQPGARRKKRGFGTGMPNGPKPHAGPSVVLC